MSRAGLPVAALVAVGDELLYGETVDTNSAWLGRFLFTLGIPVLRRYTVGDDAGQIGEAVGDAMADADLVLVSGGLGPTADDLTKEAVARLTSRELSVDEGLLSGLRERFRLRGYSEMPQPNVSQAQVPSGAHILENPFGTAPGLLLEEDSCIIVLLPGVPRELRGISEGALRGALEGRFRGRLWPIHHRLIHTTGIAESRLAELLEPTLPEDLGPVSLAFLPDLRGVDLRLSAGGVTPAEAQVWFDRMEGILDPVLGEWRFEAESGDVAETLSLALASTGRRLAVAESCTGGLIAKRITDLPGSSRVFAGGVVAYSDEVKVEMLGVSAEDLRRHGAVSEVVARQMSDGVARRLGVSAGIGVTGVAGPEGGSPDKPVGTVWLALTVDGETESHLLRLVGDRHAVRERAAQEALARLLRMLVRVGGGA